MSEQLRSARQNAGITITQLAQQAGVSRTTVEKAEKARNVRYEYAIRMVNALNTLANTNYTVEGLNIRTEQ